MSKLLDRTLGSDTVAGGLAFVFGGTAIIVVFSIVVIVGSISLINLFK